MGKDWADVTVKELMALETPELQAMYLRIMKDRHFSEAYTETREIIRKAFEAAPSVGGGDK